MITREHEKTTEPIAIADLSRTRTRLRVSGTDRVAFLHGQCTNDIKRLRVRENCYAAFLNAKGKMRGDAYIVRLEDAIMLDANTGLRESLEKFIITEDVVIEDVSEQYGAWLVIGQQAVEPTSARLTFSHPLGSGVIGEVPPGPITMSNDDLEVLRVEAGIPKWGVDMDENTIPIEAGLESRAISYEKGCYIGQETIARIKTYGHVNRHLVQMAVEGQRVPVAGDQVLNGEKEQGHVTSAAYSNRLGKMLALGYVRREFAVAGTKLIIAGKEAEVIKVI